MIDCSLFFSLHPVITTRGNDAHAAYDQPQIRKAKFVSDQCAKTASNHLCNTPGHRIQACILAAVNIRTPGNIIAVHKRHGDHFGHRDGNNKKTAIINPFEIGRFSNKNAQAIKMAP